MHPNPSKLRVKDIQYDAKMEVVKKDLAPKLRNDHEMQLLEQQSQPITHCEWDINNLNANTDLDILYVSRSF